MSLTSKIVLILSAVVALYAVTDYAIQRVTVTRSFHALEEAEALRDVERVVAAIREEETQLDQDCLSRCARDDTAAYAVASSWSSLLLPVHPLLLQEAQRYARTHLDVETFRRAGFDLQFVCDPRGRVLFGRIHDPETGQPISLRDFPKGRLGRSNPLVARGVINTKAGRSGEESRRDVESRLGIFLTERGPMLVSSRPIRDSRGTGRSRGTMILGRFLGARLIEVLSARTKVDFDLWSLDGRELPPGERAALDQVSASASRPFLSERDDELLHVYTTEPDILRAPGLLVRANVPRRVWLMGATAVRYALISTVTVGLLMLLVLLTLLNRTVLTPIKALTRNAVAFGRTEDPSVRFDLRRDDEVGILSREFDNMLAKLMGSRAALVRTARAAGMSEIATGILHNVGNVLNSINVSASMAGRKTRDLCVDDLEQLSGVLAEHAHDLASFVSGDPRGEHLQPFVQELARDMRVTQAGIADELESLTRGIDHIRELIASQQSYIGRSGVAESVALEAQLEEALSISEKALSADARLEVVREYSPLPPILVDRHKLLEILVNVVQNARQAMMQVDGPERRLTLRTIDQGERVRIEVQDNGPGISRTDLVRIFNLGFTTRPDGHGVGLHASANAAKELSGELSVASDGLGHGATFALELPKCAASATVGAA